MSILERMTSSGGPDEPAVIDAERSRRVDLLRPSRLIRVIGDTVFLHLGVAVSLAVTKTTAEEWQSVLRAAPLTIGILILVLLLVEPYRPASTTRNRPVPFLVFTAIGLAIALMAITGSAFGPVAVILGAGAGVAIALCARWLLHLIRGAEAERVVLVLSGHPRARDEEAQIVGQLQEAPKGSVVLTQVFIDGADDLRLGSRIGDTVVLSPWLEPDRRVSLAVQAHDHGWQVRVVPSIYEIVLATAPTSELWDLFVIDVDVVRGPSVGYRVVKRAIDVVASFLGLIATAPILAACAVAVRAMSPGPVIYRQARVGRDGRTFEMMKIRTMVVDAEAATGPVLAERSDPRITPIGALLRATRLDEIPQLVNILRGDMTLVGPRPERPEFVSQFEATIPGYAERHVVRPGLTGLAQVRGSYSSEPPAKLRFDLFYIRRCSLLLDLQIVLETAGAMVDRSSAEGRAPLGSVVRSLPAVSDPVPTIEERSKAS